MLGSMSLCKRCSCEAELLLLCSRCSCLRQAGSSVHRVRTRPPAGSRMSRLPAGSRMSRPPAGSGMSRLPPGSRMSRLQSCAQRSPRCRRACATLSSARVTSLPSLTCRRLACCSSIGPSALSGSTHPARAAYRSMLDRTHQVFEVHATCTSSYVHVHTSELMQAPFVYFVQFWIRINISSNDFTTHSAPFINVDVNIDSSFSFEPFSMKSSFLNGLTKVIIRKWWHAMLNSAQSLPQK